MKLRDKGFDHLLVPGLVYPCLGGIIERQNMIQQGRTSRQRRKHVLTYAWRGAAGCSGWCGQSMWVVVLFFCGSVGGSAQLELLVMLLIIGMNYHCLQRLSAIAHGDTINQ